MNGRTSKTSNMASHESYIRQSLPSMTRLVLSVVLASLLGSCGRGKGPVTSSSTTGAVNQPAAAKCEDHAPPPPPLPVPASVVVKEAIPYADGPGADPARNLLEF